MDILVGGAFANAETINKDAREFEQHMRRCKVNYVLHAFNPEEDLKNLILQKKQGKSLKHIKNLTYLENNNFEKDSFYNFHYLS